MSNPVIGVPDYVGLKLAKVATALEIGYRNYKNHDTLVSWNREFSREKKIS